MSAAEKFTFQSAPTPEQRRKIAVDHAERHPVRQYEQTQALISPVEAAGVACCAVEVEPEMELSLPVFLGWCIAGLGTWAAVGYATWWLVGLFAGVKA